MNLIANLDESGTRLRFFRIIGGETLHEMATRTDVPMPTLSQIERGALRPTPNVRKKLRETFGLPKDSLDWLFESTTRKQFILRDFMTYPHDCCGYGCGECGSHGNTCGTTEYLCAECPGVR